MSHTQGGWGRNIKPASKYPIIYAGRNTHVAQVITRGIPESEAEANADLIAAAPDLLAALEWMLPAYLAAHADACRHSGEPSLQSVAGQQIAAARAAIAKAKGDA